MSFTLNMISNMKTLNKLLIILVLSGISFSLAAYPVTQQKKPVKPVTRVTSRKPSTKNHVVEINQDEQAVKPKIAQRSTTHNQSMAGLYPYNFFSPVCPNLVY